MVLFDRWFLIQHNIFQNWDICSNLIAHVNQCLYTKRRGKYEFNRCRLKSQFISIYFRGDNKKLKNQNDQLRTRLDRALTRLRDLEDQHIQHGILQDKMRQRLRQMDEHSGKTTQQVYKYLVSL